MTTIILIRHCEARGNIDRLFQGHTDSQISENGRRQLEYLARRCEQMEFSAIYSSPLNRARLTAQAAARDKDLPIKIADDLIEINAGEFENMSWDELPVRYPDEMQKWVDAPHEFHPVGGESFREVYDRIWNAVLGIVKAHPGETVCVVSHGGAIRGFLCQANGHPVEQLGKTGWCDNTGVSVIDFDGDLQPTVRFQNDNSHVPVDMSTFAHQAWWRDE